ADLLVHDGVTRALEAAVERVAEALDAELTAIVRGEQVVASFGFPPGELPTAALHRLALTHATRVALPGIGTCSVATADLDDADDRLVLIAARLGEEAWSGSDLALLVGMARMITLATRTIRTLAVERTAREGGEQLLAIQRAIIRRAPL